MATVLLVEDDPGAREGLGLALRRLVYGVRAAGTGEAPLREVRDAGEAAADVVVLVEMLPGLAGFEVCRRTAPGPRHRGHHGDRPGRRPAHPGGPACRDRLLGGQAG